MIIKSTARFITITALFLVPIFALIVWHPFFFPFITGKGFYFRLLVEIAFAGWLILAFIDPKYRAKWTPITVGITLFALITLVADLVGVNPMRSIWSNFERMEGWMVIIHLWAFFIVILNSFGYGEEGRRMWHRWFNFELFVAFIVGLYGIGQLLGLFAIHQGSTRIDASLGNAAYMAVYLLWNVGIAVYMSFVARMQRSDSFRVLPWLYPVLAVFFAFLLIETSTRGTTLGLVGGVFVALFIYAIKAGSEAKRSRWISAGILALIIVVGISFWSLRDQSFIKNNEVLNRLASISLSNGETNARLYIWQMAIQGSLDRPVLGWGQENFNYVFNANYNPKLYSQEQWFDRAHSVYLDWLIASGFVGLLAYLALYVLFLVSVWKSGLSIGTKSALTGLLCGYAIHNVFVFDNIASYILFISALAFVSSLRDGKPMKFLGENPVLSDAVEYIVTPVVIVALVSVFYFFNVRQMQANTRLIAALTACSGSNTPEVSLFENALALDARIANQEIREQFLSCATAVIRNSNIPAQTKQSFFGFSTKTIQDQIDSSRLKDARIYSLAGIFMNNIGQYADGEKFLKTAHELSPNKQSISAELALAQINIQKFEDAVVVLRDAYELEPANGQIVSLYALSLVVVGREAEAHKMFGNNPEIFETFQMGQAYSAIRQYPRAISIFKKLLASSTDDVNLSVTLAQTQYAAGLKDEAIATLRAIEKTHPEYKEQIEATINSAK